MATFALRSGAISEKRSSVYLSGKLGPVTVLDRCILAVIHHQKGLGESLDAESLSDRQYPVHANGVWKLVEALNQQHDVPRTVNLPSVYKTLDRLHRQGCVAAEQPLNADQEESSRWRPSKGRLYVITESGLAAYELQTEILKALKRWTGGNLERYRQLELKTSD